MPRTCRECSCSDDRACIRVVDVAEIGLFFPTDGLTELGDGTTVETCGWAEPDLCSGCASGSGEWIPPARQEHAHA